MAEGVKPEKRLEEIVRVAEQHEIPVEYAKRSRLNDISTAQHHQGVVGYFHARTHDLGCADCTGEVAGTDCGSGRDSGILQQWGNRALRGRSRGRMGVAIPRQHATAVTPAAAKASAGATSIPWPIATVANVGQALDVLGGAGYWRVGLDGSGTTLYDQVDYTLAVALVIGAEGRGLGELTRKKCDILASLPMSGRSGVTQRCCSICGCFV